MIQKDLINGQTRSVYDYKFVLALKSIPMSEWMEISPPFGCRLEYLEKIDKWIHSTQLNKVRGLERFKRRDLINGTTQSFDEFYFVNRDRRLRLFRGEYAYHKRINKNFVFLEDEELQKTDYVIISLPFCSTGDKHPRMAAVLNAALEKQVPVLVDCAYFGTCKGIDLDLTHPAIDIVSFSLTKGLGLGDIRSGIRFSNINDDNPICQQNRYNHTVLHAAKIGIYMMEKFSPDFIPGKFSLSQENACRKVNIRNSPCMHIALGGDEWSDFKVDGLYNRLGIRELVKAQYREDHHLK